MHHLYPLAKGDQLCPLGFHPQVRWPTRCKRCFRDYKEHGGKRNPEDIIASSPNLSSDSSNSRTREDGKNFDKPPARSWTSSQNLSTIPTTEIINRLGLPLPKRPASWTSTPDLPDDLTQEPKNDVTVNISLPKRRHTTTLVQVEESVTVKRPPLPPSSKTTNDVPDELIIHKNDSLAERYRKMQILKRQQSAERELSSERIIPPETSKEKSPQPLKSSRKPQVKEKSTDDKSKIKEPVITNSQDVQFLIEVKNKSKDKQDDDLSTCTDTTDTTLVDRGRQDRELLEQIESLKNELDVVKSRCERAERDKSDILLRRLASMDTAPNRTAASEVLKLQQKVNEMKQQLEDLRDDKKTLSIKVRELEQDLEARPTKTIEDELRTKLQSAEQLCEELMDENEDMKKEMRNMEQEIDEMQDNFREDQVDEYTTIKKELEQTTKNCRILSFKLKKSERKIEQLESEKQATNANGDLLTKMRQLEEELRVAKEDARRLQTEAELVEKNSPKKKAPSLGKIGKSTSADGKVTRESLTRGGSQEDPSQLQRDLQDSMEREADLKEQLKFAEEEAENLRKKTSRVEDENESLMMQLKKMATKARSRKLSPTSPSRLTPEPTLLEKDEGISDEEDPAELRLLLELNEQEASLLRRKVEDLETENETIKKQLKEFEERLNSVSKPSENTTSKKLPSFLSKSTTAGKDINDKKLKALEEEVVILKKKLSDKERELDQSQSGKSSKFGLSKSKSQEFNDQQSIDFKRQLQVVEQEASVLRTKIQTLEQENDKITTENKKLQLQAARGAVKKDITITGNSSEKEKQLNSELTTLKETLKNIEMERDEINAKLKRILEASNDKLPARTPKKFSETNTKLQLKKMIDDLEMEVFEMRAIIARSNSDKSATLETEKNALATELKEVKDQLKSANSEIKTLKTKKDSLASAKTIDLEQKLKKVERENDSYLDKIGDLEEKISKQEATMKQTEAAKALLEKQIKLEKEQTSNIEKDFEKEKRERIRWEAKITEMDEDLQTARKNAEKTKATLEKEIASLKAKSSTNDTVPSKKMQELKDQIKQLETNATKENKKYNDLTGKYELLEEEHVLTKAQLTTEKEKVQTELATLKKQVTDVTEKESKTKQENIGLHKRLSDALTKISGLESKDAKNNSLELEKNRLKRNLEEKEAEFCKLKKENDMNMDQATQMKKDNEDLRQKLDDYDRINKAQRSLNDHNSSLEQEMKKLKMKLESAEMSVKSEVASTRLRYEQQVSNLQTELSSMQRQCERFKRDRDTFKQLLEGAQKTISDLKQNTGRISRGSIHSHSGDEDDKSKILALEQQIGCLEDELSEARLDGSKLKTELVSEKTASEIKISEMQSKLNEYEEERLLASRNKIPGTKTRLELSWQKEREDQQRLLQETSTLARDLRQTLFEVERERDKERLESRRKLDQLKRNTEDEMEEGRKKISELQCDLLELRDAHAKLRTANEKLRRERERFERERDNVSKRRLEQDGERKVGALLQQVDELVKIAPDLQIVTPNTSSKTSNNVVTTSTHLQPTAPRRSKSRSPSPGPGPSSVQISTVLARLAEASEELRRYQRVCEDEREREKARRSGMRRAASTENDGPGEAGSRYTSKLSRSSTHNGSLYRKSLSLDQSMQHDQQLIWKHDDDSMSSMQSIDSELGGLVRESSLDSRLSGGSTQSDIARGPRKKKRGIMGKLRSLTKTKSVDSDASHQGSDSDLSTTGDHRSSKGNLKGRLSGMFRRAGSNSRGNSTERILSDSRPVAVTTIDAGNKEPVTKTGKPPTPVATPSTQRKTK